MRNLFIKILLFLLLCTPAWGGSITTVVVGQGSGPACGDDLCTGGTAIESGHASSYVCANAFDNNETTLWSVGAWQGQWIGYNFGSQKTIVRVKIKPVSGELKNFHVEGSNNSDFSTHTDYGTFTHGNNANWETFDFENTTGYQYWRIATDSTDWTTAGVVQIQEIEMMDCIP